MSIKLLHLLALLLSLSMIRPQDCTDQEYITGECFCVERFKFPNPLVGTITGGVVENENYLYTDCLDELANNQDSFVWGYQVTPTTEVIKLPSIYFYSFTKYNTREAFCLETCKKPYLRTPKIFKLFKAPNYTGGPFTVDTSCLLFGRCWETAQDALAVAAMAEHLNYHDKREQNNLPLYIARWTKWGGPNMVYQGINLQTSAISCQTENLEHRYRIALPDSDPFSYRGLGAGYIDANELLTGDPRLSTLSDCHILECLYITLQAGNNPICSTPGVLYYNDPAQANNFTTLCQQYPNNYTTMGLTVCDTAAKCQRSGCALPQTCESTFPTGTPVCGSDYQLYTSASSYCAAKTAGTVNSYSTCDGTCDQSACDKQKCINSFSSSTSSYTNGVCQTNSGIFYSSISSFCAQAGNSKTSSRLCGPNNDQPCTQSQCCEDNCNTQGQNIGCRADTNVLTSYSTYCSQKCSGQTYNLNPCYNGGTIVDCTSCGNTCVNNLNGLYTNPSTVCGDNDVFYETKQAFCDYKAVHPSVQVLFCANNIPCNGESECCNNNCAKNNPNYPGGCYQGLDFTASVSTYCNFYCANNRTAQLVSSNPLVCCSNKCLATENKHAVCDPVSYAVVSAEDQCAVQCSNSNVTYLGCGSNDCSSNDCALKKCMDSEPNDLIAGQVVCGNNSVLYANKQSFCQAKIANSTIAYVAFPYESNFDQNNCNLQACIFNKRDSFYARCDSDNNLFTNVSQYCTSLLAGNLTLAMCDDLSQPGNQIACTEAQCRLRSCVSSFTPLCSDGPSYELQSNAEQYCAAFGLDASYADNFTSCQGGCTERDCRFKKCLTDNDERNYCGNDGQIYANKFDFCTYSVDHTSFNEAVCADNLDCNTASGCFVNTCVTSFDSSFVGVCDTAFNLYQSKVSYCEALYSDPSIALRECTNSQGQINHCTPTECCELQCLETFQPVCDTNYLLIDNGEEFCSQVCSSQNELPNIHQCDGGCTQLKCDQIDCENTNPNHGYCGSNGIFYQNNVDFCQQQISNPTLSELMCDNGSCTQEIDCKIVYCTLENNQTWYPRCDSDFYVYTDLEEYCTAKLTSDSFNDLMCGDRACNSNECCQTDCQSQEFKKVCGPSPNFVYYDNETNYCQTLCQTTDFATSVNGCTTDCTAFDCDFKKCVHVEAHDAICGSDSIYYLSKNAFCAEKLNHGVTEVLCNGDQCESDTDCCLAICHQNNPVTTYQPRCNSGYEFLETRDHYCLSLCTKKTGYHDLMCGNQYCSQNQCCAQNCNANTPNYLPVCSSTYAPLSLNLYCDSYCTDNTFTRYSCPGGCTNASCQNLKCDKALVSVTGPICLKNEYQDKHYYNNIIEYCSTKVALNDFVYTIGETANCTSSNCSNEYDCCVNRCLEDGLFTGCDGVNYKPLTPSNYCQARCRNPSQNAPFVKCYNDNNGQQENCNERKCCMKNMTLNNVPQPICASNGTVFLNYNSYCNYKANVNSAVSVLVSNELDFSICASDFQIYTNISTFCYAKFLNNAITDTGSCSGNSCNSTTCCNKKCNLSLLHPVIVDSGKGGYTAYQNSCFASCAVSNPNIIMTCAVGTSTNECYAHYCMQVKKCNTKNTKYICASDRKIYSTNCEMKCRDLTKNFDCPNTLIISQVYLNTCAVRCATS